MNRFTSFVARMFIAAAALALLGFVGSALLLAWLMAGPDPEAVLAKAQPACDPVIAALDQYHRRHGRYPGALDDLVREGLLAAVPELPPHWGTSSRSGPHYEVSNPLGFYRLSLGYCVEGGIGPGDFYWSDFVSDEPGGWKRVGSGRNMVDLIADRILATYRRRGDRASLDLFMSEVIAKAGCDGQGLAGRRVIGWLGEGEAIDLPPEVPGAVRRGSAYRARDDAGRRYVLVYKDCWLPLPTEFLPEDERAKVPPGVDEVDRNYPVLDRLFLVEEANGRATWSVLRACPPSPRDRPSGRRHRVGPK